MEFTLSIFTATLAVLATVVLGGFAALFTQVHRLEPKVDAIRRRLHEEFRAMRAEMAAETSAISNSITGVQLGVRTSRLNEGADQQ